MTPARKTYLTTLTNCYSEKIEKARKAQVLLLDEARHIRQRQILDYESYRDVQLETIPPQENPKMKSKRRGLLYYLKQLLP